VQAKSDSDAASELLTLDLKVYRFRQRYTATGAGEVAW